MTSDSQAIFKESEIHHPAANLLVGTQKVQGDQFGDGRCLLVTFAGELLSESKKLIEMGFHPNEIVQGYKKALALHLSIMEQTARVVDLKNRGVVSAVLDSVLQPRIRKCDALRDNLVDAIQ